MTEKKYLGFSVEDLLHDAEFVSTVKNISGTEEWEQFLRLHAESESNILQAKKIIQLFETKEGKLSVERTLKLWENINAFREGSARPNKLIRLKTFTKIAASILIVLSIGGIWFLHLNSVETPYQFSESTTNLKTDHPVLVLSNGNTVELEKTESKITVLKGQDAIQINNDQIVENETSKNETSIESKFNEVSIPFGKKSKLILEDGTTVWLNAGSRFAFPQKFSGKKREVFLDGEAYFDVAKDDKKPFILSTGDISIEVLGTKFNVSAYTTDNFCETVLLEGKVSLVNKGKRFGDRVVMAPSQKATYDKTGRDIVLKEEMEPEKYIVWVEGWYQFTNENLELILKKLERYYNINFEYDNAIVSSLLPVSGKLDLKDSLEEVMVVLSRVAKFEYKISGNNVVINKK